MVPVPQTRPQNPPALRRTPVQQRSAERLARILDACAGLLDESGYEQLSTRAVAARAGVPIGSVYRFFGNKRAMVAALAHRNLDEYARRISDRLAAAPLLDAYGAIDGVLDEFIEMKRTVPGFALVDFGVPAAAPGDSAEGDAGEGEREGGGEGEEAAESAAEDPNRLVVERICELLATHLNRPADDGLRRKVLVGVETADALVRLAFRTDPAGDPALIDETRQLLYAYLAPSLA
ncbi:MULTISPECIES: TetR/AcrR family transcriptional regulator [Streptomyces]|uniref:Transcriptional regulator, TetR family n=3 Tax=Streptomyces venezuelae TaxID=54571 RepID=F2RE74_STRVP|nr:TetR/AcrR family transcriptional regulator [Streptomyces venezuelae]APE20693.1 TetR family transcriptional regulator [Streptomyces venezuelae]QER98083.1 TetR/AcrR family transcriptional regulator [Streptomyces venezuelae ATCC 10712]CCA54614.1 Transcriptional regulator, TetR family [Streptomyces venezuelae ATCC 10712]